jgi:hypothetical protein
MQDWRKCEDLSEQTIDLSAYLNVICLLKHVLNCEQHFSFFIFRPGLTVTGLASGFCTLCLRRAVSYTKCLARFAQKQTLFWELNTIAASSGWTLQWLMRPSRTLPHKPVYSGGLWCEYEQMVTHITQGGGGRTDGHRDSWYWPCRIWNFVKKREKIIPNNAFI